MQSSAFVLYKHSKLYIVQLTPYLPVADKTINEWKYF